MSRKKWGLLGLGISVVLGLTYLLFVPSKTNTKDSQISFYSWENNFKIDSAQYRFLEQNNVHHLRVKILEIDWHETRNHFEVDNHLSISYRNERPDYFLNNSLTPVVFLRNELFYHIDSTHIPKLAALVKRALQIHLLDLAIDQENMFDNRWDVRYFTLRPQENKHDSLQKVYERFLGHIVSYEFDCDWTEKTKKNYFLFLRQIKDTLQAPIESTLRLHQYKYRDQMGIPPVDKVNLMCYNMGDIKNSSESNSIFDKQVLLSYLKDQKEYPVRLNLAFPMFGWKVVFRDKRFLKLISTPFSEDNQKMEEMGNHSFRIKEEWHYDWTQEPLRMGDVVRFETVSAEDIAAAYPEVLHSIQQKPEEIIFFDLQSVTEKQHFDELEKIIRR